MRRVVRVHALEVCENDLAVEAVLVIDPGVFHDGVRDVDLVFPGEVESTTGAGL